MHALQLVWPSKWTSSTCFVLIISFSWEQMIQLEDRHYVLSIETLLTLNLGFRGTGISVGLHWSGVCFQVKLFHLQCQPQLSLEVMNRTVFFRYLHLWDRWKGWFKLALGVNESVTSCLSGNSNHVRGSHQQRLQRSCRKIKSIFSSSS